MFELMTYACRKIPGASILSRSSFLFAFTLTFICTALLLVAIKKGLGLSTEISLLAGALGFFLLFALIRFRFGGDQLTGKIVGFELFTMAFAGLLIEMGMNIIFSFAPKTIPAYAFGSPELRQEFKNELEQANRAQTFEQYVMYRGAEFDGEFFNQDRDGIRATWAPDYDNNTAKTNVYMFGGSTLWGYHARDDHTIPSYLAKYLHEHGYQATVTNHGVIRDSSSTELVRLFQLLKAGHKIDFVIFYDGFNDVASGVRGMPGRFPDYDRYKEIFLNKGSGFHQIKQGLEKIVRDHSASYDLLGRLAFRGAESARAEPGLEYQNRLADQTADSYMESIGAIERLSKSYGFKYAAFWQPMAYLEPFLTEEERPRVEASNNVRMKFLVGPLVNQRLATGVMPNFYNISGALNDRQESVYVDIGHLTERGNEIMAKRMGDILLSGNLLSAAKSPGGNEDSIAEVDLK
jgi:lysophospholipase L1-like esterase